MKTTVDDPAQTLDLSQGVKSQFIQTQAVRARYAVYGVALAVSISVWLIAIRAPLWLDETGSYWQISAGFSKIWSRQYISFPAYTYILWLSTKILGTSEIALRIPSVLAMLGAVYLLYLGARELFDRDTAMVAAVVFSLHPIVIFTSTGVRPYAFGALAVNAAILVLLRLRHSDSNWLAALFGFLAACIVYFHYLFAVILPAFVVCFFVLKRGDRKTVWRQFGVASAVFAVAFLPVIPGLRYLLSSPGTHVWEKSPSALDLIMTLAPNWLLPIFVVICFVAFLVAALRIRTQDSRIRFEPWRLVVCTSLVLTPILILYGISVGSSIHIFAFYHRLVAVPGIALCWALAMNRFRPPAMRVLFCLALAAAGACMYFSPHARQTHSLTWKYALEVAEKNAASDNAPVVICSEFIESIYVPMPPLNSAKESGFFSPLSYYKLTVPVVPLPLTLNDEAIRDGSQFLKEATRKHERFLALGAADRSYMTLDWLAQRTAGTYDVHELGIFDGIKVWEFDPRARVDDQRQ